MNVYKLHSPGKTVEFVTADSEIAAVEKMYPTAGVWHDHNGLRNPNIKFYTVDLIGRPNFIVCAVKEYA